MTNSATPQPIAARAGSTYLTYGGRTLRVIEVTDGRVTYRVRNEDGSEGPAFFSPLAALETVLSAVLS